ncbi:hypothetical protein [Methylobacterium nodulans]|uniref:Uncharacterized protein n=1 Tax=Methylobacterium nodulans (strain LMG 21967 / CNCM I-2342 / ORS 2060) TaxID=460265 RepID=B8IXY1_METNO|nr:hypothetical protein [Methylobacterium nodulans]ACL63271.1 conserved hypothetical protein [Methylobacterium nodulans ORS 2060]
MGGINSGNWGGRPTVEDCLALNLPKLLRDRAVRPGHTTAGTLTWSSPHSEQTRASIGYTAILGQEHGRIRLQYRTAQRGTAIDHDYTIALLATAQPFGGWRWWFICPKAGTRTAKLYLPSGAAIFASRQAHRLAYWSQRESPRNRAISRAFKLRHQLGDRHGGIGCYIDKPKGMHRSTFERRIARLQRAEATVNAYAMALFGTCE